MATCQCDHKSIYEPQGDALGFFQRLAWVSQNPKKNPTDEFKSINIFMGLEDCDSLTNEKSNRATAEKLIRFVNGVMNLEKHQSKFQYTADHAIYQGIEKHMTELGVPNVNDRFSVCDTHNVSNLYKNKERDDKKIIKFGDTQSKFYQ